ncbi:MAG: hypothetical protein Q9223_002205 [Gallowayella weberi]
MANRFNDGQPCHYPSQSEQEQEPFLQTFFVDSLNRVNTRTKPSFGHSILIVRQSSASSTPQSSFFITLSFQVPRFSLLYPFAPFKGPKQAPFRRLTLAASSTMPKRQSQNRSLSPPPAEPSTVYIVRLLEGWRENQEDTGHISVPILGVFQHVIHANDFARRWLQQTWPAQYQYGDPKPEKEKKRQGGGIQLYILTDNEDGSVMIDVEKHSVLQGLLSVRC